jgi:ketosteroid isomerase-like protein
VTSQEKRLETVQLLNNRVWAGGDLDAAPSVLHPDVVWIEIESAPDAGTRHGFEECRAYMQDWLDDIAMEPMRIEATARGEDRLVCDQLGAGTGRGSGLRTEIRYGVVYRFSSDGRIREIHEYATLQGPPGRRAAGLGLARPRHRLIVGFRAGQERPPGGHSLTDQPTASLVDSPASGRADIGSPTRRPRRAHTPSVLGDQGAAAVGPGCLPWWR